MNNDDPADDQTMPCRILVVDDDPMSARLMKLFLRPTGHHVERAVSPCLEPAAEAIRVQVDADIEDLVQEFIERLRSE